MIIMIMIIIIIIIIIMIIVMIAQAKRFCSELFVYCGRLQAFVVW
jgi:hypothetical protein